MTDVRLLEPGELRDAVRLVNAEGWTFDLDDLDRLDRLGGSVGALEGGRVVGFLSFVDLDPVRWVGNVAVDPKRRGAGLGQRLVEEALRHPPRIRTVGLYSVEKAVTLYSRLGFVAQGEAFAMRAEDAQPAGPVRGIEPLDESHLPDVFRLDRAQTGMDRRALLGELAATWPDHACVVRDVKGVTGFGFAKPYADLTELGPIVATTPAAANAILDALLTVSPTPHEATVLGANPQAVAALEKRGFARAFRTVPMFRGPPPAWTPSNLAVAAGLEKS